MLLPLPNCHWQGTVVSIFFQSIFIEDSKKKMITEPRKDLQYEVRKHKTLYRLGAVTYHSRGIQR